MDYLQYYANIYNSEVMVLGFKPCYKWITFNTKKEIEEKVKKGLSFKPCYKWITFNTH